MLKLMNSDYKLSLYVLLLLLEFPVIYIYGLIWYTVVRFKEP